MTFSDQEVPCSITDSTVEFSLVENYTTACTDQMLLCPLSCSVLCCLRRRSYSLLTTCQSLQLCMFTYTWSRENKKVLLQRKTIKLSRIFNSCNSVSISFFFLLWIAATPKTMDSILIMFFDIQFFFRRTKWQVVEPGFKRYLGCSFFISLAPKTMNPTLVSILLNSLK